MKRTSSYVFASFLFLFSSASTIAAETNSQLPDSSLVSRVEIILTPERITTIRPLREQDLPTWGCTFQSSSNKKIEDLLNLLKTNISYSNDKYEYQLRNLVYFHMNSGKKITYLFSDGYHESKLTVGTFNSEINSQSLTVTTQPSLLKNLRLWASQDVDRKNFSEFCIK